MDATMTAATGPKRTTCPTCGGDGTPCVDCRRGRAIADRVRVLRTLAEANGGTFSVKADAITRGLIARGVIRRVGSAGRGGWHAAHYRFVEG